MCFHSTCNNIKHENQPQAQASHSIPPTTAQDYVYTCQEKVTTVNIIVTGTHIDRTEGIQDITHLFQQMKK